MITTAAAATVSSVIGSTRSKRGRKARRSRESLPRRRSKTNFNGHGSRRRRPTSTKSAITEIAIRPLQFRTCGQKYFEIRHKPGRLSGRFAGFDMLNSTPSLMRSRPALIAPSRFGKPRSVRRRFFGCDQITGLSRRGQGNEVSSSPPRAVEAERRTSAPADSLAPAIDQGLNRVPEVFALERVRLDHGEQTQPLKSPGANGLLAARKSSRNTT